MNIFESIIGVNGLEMKSFAISLVVAIVTGLIIAFVHMYKTRSSQSFIVTLALMPTMVAVIILLVNGNIGTGIAVAGAFSLTRFRSQPGTGKEIGSIFFAMVTGLACGTGYVGVAGVFVVVVSLLSILYTTIGLGTPDNKLRELTIVIPENLDYTEIFDDLFEEYTTSAELVKSRTTNMGSMYKLRYEIAFKKDVNEKKFMDDIRVRNGNLEVMLGRVEISDTSI